MRTKFDLFIRSQQQILNKFVARKFSLPKYQLRKDLTVFSKLIGLQRLVLDIGSGTEKPYRELFRADVHFCIDLFETSDVIGDIKALPFTNNSADLILCTEVLEHVPDPSSALCETRRVLKDAQHLILTIPFLWGDHDYVDYQRWTEKGIRKLLDETGYDILALRKRGGIFSSIGCLLANIPQEIFGTFANQKNWVTKIAYLIFIIIILPLPWFFSIFDFLDREGKWVVGFSILCKKRKIL